MVSEEGSSSLFVNQTKMNIRTTSYKLNLPVADAAASNKLLQYLIAESHIVEELLLYDYNETQIPVALKYIHTCTTFHMDTILQYLTSDTSEEIPENAAVFFDLFMRGVGVPKSFWNTKKRKILQYELETPSHDIQGQFAYLNSNDRSLANSLLRCLMNPDLDGRLSLDKLTDDAKEGLCVMFPGDVKGGRLRDYICYLIGRNNSIKPVFMVYFFNSFVSGVNCYPLMPTHVLKQFVAEENLPERKALAKSFPLRPEMEMVVSKLRGSVLYAKGRKLMFELSEFLGEAFEVEPETRRIIHVNQDADNCIGSTMDNMLRFLVGPHSPRRNVLFDALTFYQEVIAVNGVDDVLFGKGTFEFLHSLSKEQEAPSTGDRPPVAVDQGNKPVRCPQCEFIFGPKGAIVNLTEINILPLRSNTLLLSDDMFEPPTLKRMRTVDFSCKTAVGTDGILAVELSEQENK